MMMNEPLRFDALRGTLARDASLARYTSWRCGGAADRLYLPADRDDLAAFVRQLPENEPLTVVGLGTWRSFHVGASVAERAPLREVLETLFGAGGSLIDSSPMYGPAEQVVGDLLAAMAARQRAFIATKVWTHGREDGIRQMNESMRLLRVQRLDLMQVQEKALLQTEFQM